MKKLLLFLLWLCGTCNLQAQLINGGWAYGGTGNQQAQQCYVDRLGNRYQIFTYNTNFVIDSSGYPITIQKNINATSNNYNNSLAIVKFDTAGKYVYHIRLCPAYSDYGAQLDLKFNTSNEIFLCYNFAQADSVDLFDSKGILYKKIKPQYNRRSTDGNHMATIICRLSAGGQFIWTNIIARENLPSTFGASFFNYLTLSNTNEVRIYFPNIRTDSLSTTDTLTVTNDLNQKSLFFVNTQYVLFKFSAAGVLLLVNEPFKNRLSYYHADSSRYIRILNMITDGYKTYVAMSFNLTKADTFQAGSQILLKSGRCYLLIKLNEQDSILWAKAISRDLYANYPQINHFDIDTLKQELVLCADYAPFYYEFLLNLSFTNNQTGGYICKLDLSGNIIWEDFYSSTGFASITSNYLTKQLVLVGKTDGSDMKFQKYMPANPLSQPIAFVAYLDSLNTICSAQPFISNSTDMSSKIRMNALKIGYPITDHKGRTFISGWFADSISLPCQKLKATMETDQYGSPLQDGFVLMLGAQLPIYTQACKSIVSPSTKYVWDSTGYYFDTIPNHLGCDSILLYNVKILASKSTLDTGVCKNMVSYSGKYLWDSTGTYYDTIPNSANCDSLIKVHLTVLQSSKTIDTTVKAVLLSPSGKYSWNSSGIYKDTLISTRGCDSILTIRLTVLQTKSTIDTSICRNMVSPSGNYFYTITGTYIDTLANKIGGDSIITIHLKILQTYNTIDTTYCRSYTSPSGRYTWSVSGTYSDTIPNSKNCDSILTIQLAVKPLRLSVSKSNNITCYSSFAYLMASGGNSYLWKPATGLSDATIAKPLATPVVQTMYYVTAKDSLGCSAIDSIEIRVNKNDSMGFLPNVFTPNDDGYNDCFELSSLTQFKEVELLVYNRWGNLIFQSTDPNLCWDGKTEANVNEGVCFYILTGRTICGNQLNIHGTLTILK